VVRGAQWMTPGHPGARKTHDIPRHLPFCRLVTVDRAIRAGWLVCAIRTLLQPSLGVSHQAGTLCAKISALVIIMMMSTIQARHANQRFMLAFQSAGEASHGSIIKVFTIHLFDRDQCP